MIFIKILVFSDSHSDSSKIVEAIELHHGKCDLVIFLGDGLRDLDYVKSKYPQLSYLSVRGNCDFFLSDDEPTELIIDLDGIKLLLTHGHKFGVKSALGTLISYAISKDVDAVLFGHTHIPLDTCEYVGEKRIQLFNPGSIRSSNTYGVVNTSNKVLVTSIAKIR